MKKIIELDLSPSESNWDSEIRTLISAMIQVPVNEISAVKLLKRSLDARQKEIRIHHIVEVFINEVPEENPEYQFHYQNVSDKQRIIIVGAGPAGLFAALRLLELGVKPVIIERGKKVGDRKADIADINKKRIIDPDSNYCFGEGGAGTFSDGKLYTRSTKRGDVKRILYQLTHHGAIPDILVDTHPHIGTDKLPGIISQIRETILSNGGEIHFGRRVTDIIVHDGKAKGVTSGENIYEGEALILSTGHSSRDIYKILAKKKILIEPKPFAVGLRIEHPQQLIDSIQYHNAVRNPFLPAASYSLACQAGKKGVFSFCMCPGGSIVTASTKPKELVLNGMSNSLRNQPFANSGIVVTVDEKDFADIHGYPLSGINFQEELESKAFIAGGSDLTAPAQNMIDFVENKLSGKLNATSYYPGIANAPLQELLPGFIVTRLQEAFNIFGKKMKGYLTNEATLLGVETRTSSPVRIPRDSVTLEHLEIANLYPCGEGAGYAGGIISSAIDGQRCAESAAKKIH